jgi:hypothetical protein
MVRRTFASAIVAFVLSMLAATDVTAVGQRSFVSGSGADVGTCTLPAPCRSFGYAITQTNSGGEVVVLDSAGYGPVTITQSVSIIAPTGVYAGISAFSGSAVTIAAAGVDVILRGLSLNGTGGATGVSMTNGSRLSIESSIVSGFSGNGIFVNAPADVRIVDTVVRENGGYGIQLQGGASGAIASSKIFGNGFIGVAAEGAVASTVSTVVVTDSVVSGNLFGIIARSLGPATGDTRVSVIRSTIANNGSSAIVAVSGSGASAILTLTGSLVARNACGVLASGAGATLQTLGTNTVRQNNPDNCGAISGGVISTVAEF